MKLLDRVLNESTEQGAALDIFIKKAKHDPKMEEWNEKGVNQWQIVFRWNDVPNPNFGYSYFIDTLMDEYWHKNSDLVLDANTYEYKSMSDESMKRVRSFIQQFVDANNLPLEKEKETA
tara:strand:+ start:454 stop:810 length:357 start_codon:yes stop_codon:yes gene_type:complete